ncbi:MAG: hypothetical protein HRT47_05190 [Candidatus Caenarcaniphilales bacterium]|nr:hypothetical protein [Candidatus Caenarcaniphilales bacterium]
MGLVINTNRLSLDAQAALRTNNRELEITTRRLSTGKRVITAGDDAAGMTIAQRITSDVKAYRKTMQNQMDGISLIQVAEGQVQSMQDDLQRIRELMIQGANGTNGVDERNALQREINERVKNVGDIAANTRFNSVLLLRGSVGNKTDQVDRTIQSGITFSEVTTMQFGPAHINGEGAAGFTFTPERGINVDVNFRSIALTSTAAQADLDVANTAFNLSFNYVDEQIEDMIDEMTAQGVGANAALEAWLRAFQTAAGPGTGQYAAVNMQSLLTDLHNVEYGIAAAANNAPVAAPAAGDITPAQLEIINYFLHEGGQLVEGSSTPGFMIERLRIPGATITAPDNITNADHGNLDDITRMIDNLSRMRSHLGALQGSMEAKINAQDIAVVNLEASKSRIIDADMALESSNIAKQQILQQSGIAMLAQANAQPEQLLNLLP